MLDFEIDEYSLFSSLLSEEGFILSRVNGADRKNEALEPANCMFLAVFQVIFSKQRPSFYLQNGSTI